MPDLTKLSERKLTELIAQRTAAHHANVKAMIAAGHGDARGADIEEMAKGSSLLSITLLARQYLQTRAAERDAWAEEDRRLRWHGSRKPIKRTA